MTFGPATLLAIAAAIIATILWALARRLAWPEWAAMFLFGAALAVVILAGPLIRLP